MISCFPRDPVRNVICVLVVVGLTACVAPPASFRCASSDQCAGGVCQPNGSCSFGDPACPSGQRYGSASGELAGVCVGADPGTGANPPCDPTRPFASPVLVQGVASATEDASMRLSPDELTAYFFSARSGTKLLYSATRSSPTVPFERVSVLANVNSADQYNPAITSDGLSLFFATYRAGGPGDNDIYQARRSATTADFTDIRLAANLNTATSEVQPYVTRDGTAIYFVRRLPAGQTVMRAIGSPTAGFTNPGAVPELDGPTNDTDPVVTADGLTLFWGSDRSGGMGDVDIWQASRATASEAFRDLALVTSINSPAFDAPSDVSPDGCRLYLTSMRDGKTSIYVATRPPP
jgi:Tol biopolymer transport system component